MGPPNLKGNETVRIDPNRLNCLETPQRPERKTIKVDITKLQGLETMQRPVRRSYKWPLSAAACITGLCLLCFSISGNITGKAEENIIPEYAADSGNVSVTYTDFEPEEASITETEPEEDVTELSEILEEESVAVEEDISGDAVENDSQDEEDVSENAVENDSQAEEDVSEDAVENDSQDEEDISGDAVENDSQDEENVSGDAVDENSQTEEPAAEVTVDEEPEEEVSDLFMTNVKTALNVRTEPSEDAEKVGLLYKDCGGRILERRDGWTRIESGDLVGWASDTYLLFDEEAQVMADEVGNWIITTKAEGLRVRQEPNTDSLILGIITEKDSLEVIDVAEGWANVWFKGHSGYVSTDYAEIEFQIDTGETTESIQNREKARKQASAEQMKVTDRDDLTQLAAIIYCEAGSEPYEGQIGVGAVVMNRVNSGAYPNTVPGVIRASGQFSPVKSGKFDRVLNSGNIPQSCYQAAQEAMSGVSTVGGSTYFKNLAKAGAHAGITIGNHVFW